MEFFDYRILIKRLYFLCSLITSLYFSIFFVLLKYNLTQYIFFAQYLAFRKKSNKISFV